MNLHFNRRTFLKMTGTTLAGAALSGCQLNALGRPQFELDPRPLALHSDAWRILNRVTFGPRSEEREQIAEIGPAAFIEAQLAPQSIGEETRAMLKIRRLESLHMDHSLIFDMREAVVKRELQQAALLRAIYSRRQLYEIMVDFWSDHFNISQLKDDCAWLKTIDDREVIRPHAMGNFRDLLFASTHSPAMLTYLDNQENHAGNPNENYARELMELHTLGVEGGYTQTDVREAARTLTGWTVKTSFYRGQFAFEPDQHDDGPKTVFGLQILAGLQQEGGERLLEMLASHPTTARFIATKLVRRFVADEPPPALVDDAARTFLKTEGDITATLRMILLSPEFLSPRRPQPKLKRPLNFVVSTLRQLNAHTNGGPPLLDFLAQMGQPLFQWPTPDGFPDKSEAWQGSLFTRWRFALALTKGKIPGTTLDSALRQGASLPDQLTHTATLLFGQPLPPSMIEELVTAPNPQDERGLLAALLGSPAFQWC